MTISEALSGVHIATLDAEVLLAHVLESSRTMLVAHGDRELSPEELARFQSYVQRREAHEPVAYIIGEKEFFGRNFLVDARVLIPRPATERLVEIALQFLEKPRNGIQEIDTGIVAVTRVLQDVAPSVIVDIGTGSGCIPITMQLEGRTEHMIGVDSSSDALGVARSNAEVWGATIRWELSDGIEYLQKIKEPFFLISNPPYIPEDMELESDVSDYEPATALFAGSDGMNLLRPLVHAAELHPLCTGYALELREDQLMSG